MIAAMRTMLSTIYIKKKINKLFRKRNKNGNNNAECVKIISFEFFEWNYMSVGKKKKLEIEYGKKGV